MNLEVLNEEMISLTFEPGCYYTQRDGEKARFVGYDSNGDLVFEHFTNVTASRVCDRGHYFESQRKPQYRDLTRLRGTDIVSRWKDEP